MLREFSRKVSGLCRGLVLCSSVAGIKTGIEPLQPIQIFPRVLCEVWSKYNNFVTVTEDEQGYRTLSFGEKNKLEGRDIQGKVKPLPNKEFVPDPNEICCSYLRTMISAGLSFLMKQQPSENMFQKSRVLMIGLGAGTLPNFFATHYNKMNTEVVEIDKTVVDVAHEFLGINKTKNLQIIVEDAQEYTRKTKSRYDLIYVDAFTDSGMPPAFVSTSFLQSLQKILSSEGIVVSNVHTRDLKSFNDTVTQFKTVFNPIYILDVKGESNVILVALSNKKEISKNEIISLASQLNQRHPNTNFNMQDCMTFGFQASKQASLIEAFKLWTAA